MTQDGPVRGEAPKGEFGDQKCSEVRNVRRRFRVRPMTLAGDKNSQGKTEPGGIAPARRDSIETLGPVSFFLIVLVSCGRQRTQEFGAPERGKVLR